MQQRLGEPRRGVGGRLDGQVIGAAAWHQVPAGMSRVSIIGVATLTTSARQPASASHLALP